MTPKHVHRYEKTVLGKNGYTVFRCNLPACSHYVHEKLVAGKRALCNRCGGEMIMDTRAMKLTKPHCSECIQVRKKPEHDTILEFLEKEGL